MLLKVTQFTDVIINGRKGSRVCAYIHNDIVCQIVYQRKLTDNNVELCGLVIVMKETVILLHVAILSKLFVDNLN